MHPLYDVSRGIVADDVPVGRGGLAGGSVVRGDATATSDLDITVLLAGEPAPYRHSLRYDDSRN